MNANETHFYRRGYNAGSRGKWPDHRPPCPPDELLAAFMKAALQLRDAYDDFLARCGPGDDEAESMFGPAIDAMDEAGRQIGFWIRGAKP